MHDDDDFIDKELVNFFRNEDFENSPNIIIEFWGGKMDGTVVESHKRETYVNSKSIFTGLFNQISKNLMGNSGLYYCRGEFYYLNKMGYNHFQFIYKEEK